MIYHKIEDEVSELVKNAQEFNNGMPKHIFEGYVKSLEDKFGDIEIHLYMRAEKINALEIRRENSLVWQHFMVD